MKILTSTQIEFFEMLDKAPFLKGLWDIQKAEYLPERVDAFLATASHGEALIARFFLGVWRHDNEFSYDFFESTRVLDKKNLEIIRDWMSAPFWA